MKKKLIITMSVLWIAVIVALVYIGTSVQTREPKYAGEDRLVGVEPISGGAVTASAPDRSQETGVGAAVGAPLQNSDESGAVGSPNSKAGKAGKTASDEESKSDKSDPTKSSKNSIKPTTDKTSDSGKNSSNKAASGKSTNNNDKNNSTKNKAKTISFTIQCKNIINKKDIWRSGLEEFIPKSGVYFSGKVKYEANKSVYDYLKKICNSNDILLDAKYTPLYETYYVAGIGNLYEFDCGGQSGWKYSVNGKLPGVGCSRHFPQPGDVVVFFYDTRI
ncbi:MAG: DUF4430 domain-containing protein [Eubacterium sp.]|nr:DUF4430 domain-containing protein [Eubacterium sp.]